MRDHMAEVQYVKKMVGSTSMVVGYVPYGHVLHIWFSSGQAAHPWPLCGFNDYRNKERPVNWGDGICKRCLGQLGYKQVEDAQPEEGGGS